MTSERVRLKPLSGIRFRLMIWSGPSATCFAGTAQTPLVTVTVDGTATLAVNTDFSVAKPVTPDAGGDAAVDNGTVQSAIGAAKNDAKKNGNTANGVAVVIPVTPKEGQNSFNVTINAQTLNTLVREKVKRLEINIEGVVVGGMDTKLLKWLDTLSANGDVIFRVKQTDLSGLSKEAKTAIGTRPVYDLSLAGCKTIKNGTISIRTVQWRSIPPMEAVYA